MSRPPSPANSCLIDLDASIAEIEDNNNEQSIEDLQRPNRNNISSPDIGPLIRSRDGPLPQQELEEFLEKVHLEDKNQHSYRDDVD